jgi:ATP/ADP translocase/HEAT repeat protein
MSTRLERALEAGLRIRPGEGRRVATMAAYAANAIGAVVVGRSIRDALYLANRPAKGLAGMYILSSLAIVLISYAYARIADKVPRGPLNAASALGSGALCAAFWAVLALPHGEWVYPALYIFVEAMGSLVVIQFWTMCNDVFHAREAKRLFGLIGGGGTLANVIFGLLVGKYARTIGAPNLLWLMVGQLVLCALFAFGAARFATAAPPSSRRMRPARKTPMLSRAGLAFLGNRHLALVAGIGAVSAAAVTIVDFQFKLSAASVLQQNELAGYFGRFYGVCGGVALAIQIWVTSRVLERYGILASLLPLPIGLAVGSSFGAAWPNPNNLFVSSLAKGSDTIFRYTINDASMQLLYVPVQPHIRGRAKAFIDGVLKPTAVALTGAVLFFYKQAGGRGAPLAAAVLLLVALWILLLVRARREYVRSLVESLQRRHLDLSSTTFSGLNEATLNALRTALRSDPATALHALTLVQQHAQSIDFTRELRQLLKHGDPRIRAGAVQQLGEQKKAEALAEMRALLGDPTPEVRAAALGAVCAIELEAAVPAVLPFLEVKNAPEAVVRAAAAVALIRHAGIDGVLAAAEPLKQLLGAADPRDRAAAADALGNIGVRGFFRPLLAFLRDADVMVRRRAIAAAGKLRTPELIAALVEQFRRRETALEAASALAAFGPGIEPQLQAILLDESADVDCRRGCALVLQRVGTREAADALLAALIAREPTVRKAAARALSRLTRRQRLGIDHGKVERAVHSELAGARLALAAQKKLALALPKPGKAPATPAELLGVALLEERDSRVLQALLLLEVMLPEVHLDVVAENLRSESQSARGNAIEVLDNALPERWKRLVLAALDEVKRRSDQVYADARIMLELLAALIAGESGLWVAACTARWTLDAPSLPLTALLPSMQAALHSPAAPLREAAALAVARANPSDAPRLLGALANDPAASVAQTVRTLLKKAAPRAIA